ncbi:MYXO-CTERM sorting domain-containing protein [Paraliomyxa miuraensis]|uniref:MYXO-CTERM sorting domain-containing protein n=1 Tax=Paraliomyxa miuraensis TaxID=376150 RepID=UPI00225AD2D3|nr:MYXO-CTERM sorting domain-containing protein [Paraliomyxa miuraensis]MCX4247596.1 MYXO-CTERM sorting domain-containing protein [Paraliomyxa miuraensis]
MTRGLETTTTRLLTVPVVGALVMTAAGSARAATPTYYNNLAAFEADIIVSVTDDYQNPAYVFNQSDAVMSAVIGETDYMTTGHLNWNLVVGGGHYCAGCNGSFQLSFQTTSVGNVVGVNGAGFDIASSDNTYFAYITFGDGTTANIQLPPAGTFWGVAAPERIQSIHVGLSGGGSTTNGYIEIDDLIVGDGPVGTCMIDADCIDDLDPCTDQVCNMGLCTYPFNTDPCDDDEVCTENDVCSGGLCQGSLVSCDDGNACTLDYCDFGVGCAQLDLTDPCDDGDPCTEMDACSGGACMGMPTNCADDDVCTADSCDPVMGCVSDVISGCCTNDDYCGEEEVCDLDAQECVPAAGSTGGGGSTGPVDSGDTVGPTGTGAADSSGGGGEDVGATTVLGDSGGSTGGASTSDTGAGLDDGAITPGSSGCGCSNGASPQGERGWWLVVILGALARRRRSRARG